MEEFYNTTFPGQINANGDQPLESIRTRPYHYRAYNLAALVTNARIGDYVGLTPSGWNRTTASGATLSDAFRELNPIIAALSSKMGDPDGTYAAFMRKTDPFYPAQPYFALSEGLDDAGIKQGLIHTTYGPPAAQATDGSTKHGR